MRRTGSGSQPRPRESSSSASLTPRSKLTRSRDTVAGRDGLEPSPDDRNAGDDTFPPSSGSPPAFGVVDEVSTLRVANRLAMERVATLERQLEERTKQVHQQQSKSVELRQKVTDLTHAVEALKRRMSTTNTNSVTNESEPSIVPRLQRSQRSMEVQTEEDPFALHEVKISELEASHLAATAALNETIATLREEVSLLHKEATENANERKLAADDHQRVLQQRDSLRESLSHVKEWIQATLLFASAPHCLEGGANPRGSRSTLQSVWETLTVDDINAMHPDTIASWVGALARGASFMSEDAPRHTNIKHSSTATQRHSSDGNAQRSLLEELAVAASCARTSDISMSPSNRREGLATRSSESRSVALSLSDDDEVRLLEKRLTAIHQLLAKSSPGGSSSAIPPALRRGIEDEERIIQGKLADIVEARRAALLRSKVHNVNGNGVANVPGWAAARHTDVIEIEMAPSMGVSRDPSPPPRSFNTFPGLVVPQPQHPSVNKRFPFADESEFSMRSPSEAVKQ